MQFKANQQEIKDLDEAQGIVVAYANAYDVEDSDGDISAQGSFTKTVSENSKRIRVLKDHNSTISLGVPLDIDTSDTFGLKTTTQFNMKKEVSRDMFTDIKLYTENNLNAELSIGYEVVKRDKDNSKIIKEYKLYEYSFLTAWAANHMATVTGVKDLSTHYGILDLITKAYDLDYSDMRLKQIENLLISLSDEPGAHSVKADDIEAIFNTFNQKLKIEELFHGTH
jgi:HK97 family phage prohead protease